MRTKLVCTLLLAGTVAYGTARAYEERRASAMDDYHWGIRDAAEVFGYSAVSVPRETWVCRDVEGDSSLKCIALPPGTLILIPTEPDSLGVE